MVLGNPNRIVIYKIMKLDLYLLTQYIKINFKWIKKPKYKS